MSAILYSTALIRSVYTSVEGKKFVNDVDLPSLLPRMLSRLWKFALRICGNNLDASFLVERSCADALEHTDQLHAGVNPLCYMYFIMQSIWIDEMHARGVIDSLPLHREDSLPDRLLKFDAERPDQYGTYKKIVETVLQLPELLRMAVLLIEVENFTYEETAAALGFSTDEAKRLFFLARREIGLMRIAPAESLFD